MDLDAIVARALAEDVGAGDVTTTATVPPGTRARARITQKQPGAVFGLDAAEATFRALDPGVRLTRQAAEGRWREGGPVLDIEGDAAALLDRGTDRAELPPAALGRGDGDRALRRGGRGHGRARARHPQDDARATGAREGRGRRGRRDEPPRRALRRDPHQGEPRRDGGRCRRGGPGGARGRAARPARGRVPDDRRGRRGAGGRRAAAAPRQHDPPRCCARSSPAWTAGRSSRPAAA